MSQRRQRLIAKITAAIEGMDDINVSDGAAWKAMAVDVAKTLKTAPSKPPAVKRLLQEAVDGLDRLGGGGVTDLLAAVGAVAETLEAVKAALDGRSDERRAAAVRLAAALGPNGPAAGVEGEAHGLSLDEAAALLIRLDPHDREGWRRLEAALVRLARAAACGPAGRDGLDQAARLCREAACGAAADLPACIARIGELLDDAMSALDLPAAAAAVSDPSAAAPAAGPPVGGAECLPANFDPDLMAEFITESTELIQNAEEALLSLEHDPEDMESVGKVFRAFHTVKGTAGFLDLARVAEMGHHAETLLSRVRDGEIRYGGGYADLTLQALDMIKHLVAAVQQALAGAPLRKPEGYDELLAVLKNPEAAGISQEPAEAPAPRVGDILVAQGKAEREQVEAALSEHPEEKAGVALVKSQAASIADVGRALRAQKQMRSGGTVVDAGVRVSTQRLDRLIDMVGELVIAHSMVAQDGLVVDGGNHGLAKKVAHTTKIVRELQDISMSMRMVPLKATFGKMARLARDVSRKLGKNVDFVTEGEETEIDRNLVDIVNDPLVHMVRNAVDHGVETPEERRAAGKPEQGRVKIAAYHSAGSVVVEISDDGKGLDRQVLLAKARERGLVGENAELSDREVFNLVFEPGFSTAKVVTDVSGRGVGMDVVKKNIERLRGTVEIRSEKGAGSVFKMSLPLTLAIIDGMVIRVGCETYVIPTISIIRSVKPAEEDVSTVFGKGEMLRLQGRLIPLYRIGRVYGLAGAKEEIKEAIVVMVEDEERQAGLVVDELVGRQQVVIKSLGQTMKNIPGISGGAIMPDGRVGLILDIGGLLRFATPERRDGHRDEAAGNPRQAWAA
ncbi:MAG: chemotaxis protein CheA [Desulfobacterales bacterium]|jgi:two-component system chemotaxis sensor kinase CheA|nr:chemotaxis protein CheA [Desulfobacterales bacterium]